MANDQEVLAFFRQELSLITTLTLKPIPLELDTPLQDYAAEEGELLDAIEKYNDVFGVEVSMLNINCYFPWKRAWFFRQWFTQKPLKQVSKVLTVRMFANSAKAGRWLYD